MSAPNYHNVAAHTGSRKNNDSKIHNGLYTSVHKHTGGLTIFTGSMYGFGAGVMFASGSSIAGNAQGGGKFTFVEGGEINFQDFADANNTLNLGKGADSIIPISCYSISSSTAEPDVYTFKRKD